MIISIEQSTIKPFYCSTNQWWASTYFQKPLLFPESQTVFLDLKTVLKRDRGGCKPLGIGTNQALPMSQ